jgi:quinol monooxygenase YgiN
MFIVHVFVHVKEDKVEGFKAASIENAKNSINEPGVARFDVVQQQDDPTRFVLQGRNGKDLQFAGKGI